MNLKVLSINIDEGTIAYLKKLKRERSLQEGRDVSVSELVRIAIDKEYPVRDIQKD